MFNIKMDIKWDIKLYVHCTHTHNEQWLSVHICNVDVSECTFVMYEVWFGIIICVVYIGRAERVLNDYDYIK